MNDIPAVPTQGHLRSCIDPRFHDAALFAVHGLIDGDAPDLVSSVGNLSRRLQDLGVVTGIHQIRSKPAADCCRPDDLVAAAERLGTGPERCVVVTDTAAVIAAARTAGFAMIIALSGDEIIARSDAAGADVVIDDPVEIDIRTGYLRLSALPSALGSIGQIVSAASDRSPIVFLDFDGTLSQITGDPAAAVILPEAAIALHTLKSSGPVAVISGRTLSDIRARVPIGGLWYAGSHGGELADPDGRGVHNAIAGPSIRQVRNVKSELITKLHEFPGVYVEDKLMSVSVHYRHADPTRIPQLIAAVDAVGRRHGLVTTHGRRVVELRPAGASNKADAVHWIMGQIHTPSTPLPIYIGDDLTDEDGLDRVRFDGIGIVVRHDEESDRCSAAHYAVDSPQEVAAVLGHLGRDLAQRSTADTDAWRVVFDGYRPSSERLREVLCAVGNGVMVARASAPEADCGPDHYPGTYRAGVYNRVSDTIDGVAVSNECIVNLPNWLPTTFRIDGGPWFAIDNCGILSYRQTIDLQHAECLREFEFEDSAGRRTRIVQRRFASMHDPHVCGLSTTLTPRNWSGLVEVRSTTDGDVTNCGVARYAALSGRHLESPKVTDLSDGSVLVDTCTTQSRIPIAVATRTTMWSGQHAIEPSSRFVRQGSSAGYELGCTVGIDVELTIEKIAVVFTGSDLAISAPHDASRDLLPRLGRYADLLDAHRRSWRRLWRTFEFDLPLAVESVRILRLHVMHILQTLSPNSTDLDIGVPARGLHGEAYRGHIFWDELFVIPLLSLRLPHVSRSLLGYRYRRLTQARHAASAAGYAGALYPWQSGSDGTEESQRMHLNPLSGRWTPDSSHLAHHIGSAVAYNVWQYYQITGDRSYLIEEGAEILVEVARFWASRCRYDEARRRYVITGVIGPDEFHSGYPGRAHVGVDNNAYTNVMAVWVIMRAFEVLEELPLPDRLDLLERTHITGDELAQWNSVSRHMYVPFHAGVISQFEGYQNLTELDWNAYRDRYSDLGRLDRILESEGDDINRYKAAKQADVLMLFYLLSADELRELFARLGYRFLPEQIPQTIDYYLNRTSHGSTLSAVVHSWVSARGNRDRAMHYFGRVLQSDIADVQGGTTAEGIHLAAMAGSLDLLQRCFTGLEARGGRLVLGPMWPEDAGTLRSSIWYRGHRLRIAITGRTAVVVADPTGAAPIEVECRGMVQSLASGQTVYLV